MGIRRRSRAGETAAALPVPEQASGGDVQSEEHPAKKRIRMAAELADAMRQTGGRHRADQNPLAGLGPEWKVQIAIVPNDGRTSAGS